jgi:hypothetical protein
VAQGLAEPLVYTSMHPTHAAVLMLAVTRADTAALNSAARARMHDAGLLTGPTLTVHAPGLGERAFAAGDHVMVQRNT